MFTSKSLVRNLSGTPNYDSNHSFFIARRRYKKLLCAGGNACCSNGRTLLRLGLLFTGVSVFAGQVTEAVPCAAGEFLGTTTYVSTKYVAIAAGPWSEGTISWSRSVTFACTRHTTVVNACYRSKWARFWAWKPTMKTVTRTWFQLANRVRKETVWFCASTPSNSIADTEFKDAEVLEGIRDDVPGSLVHALGLVALTIGHPGEGVPDTATFQDVLVDYGNRFSMTKATFDDLFASGLSVQIPEEARMDEIIDEMGAALFDVGVELGTGAPSEPSPFRSVANLLDELVARPSMATDPIYSGAFPNLVSASQAMTNLGDMIAGGFTDDAVRLNFLTGIEEFRRAFADFACGFGELDGGICGNNIVDGDEACDGPDDDACPGQCRADCTCPKPPIPTVSEWGVVILSLLMLTGIAIKFGRRRVVHA